MRSLTRKVWQRTDVAVLAACLTAGAVLLALPASWKEALGRSVVATVFAPLEKPLAQLRSLAASRTENKALRQELSWVSLENASLRQAAAENSALRELLVLKGRWQWSLAAAEVSARQPGIFAPDLVVDKGTADGLRPGMVVISTMGLVGRLSGAEGRASFVQTVFHPDLRVSAIDTRSRVLGIIKHQVGKGMVMDRVPLHSDVRPGDTLVSSGYGGVMPYGLMLGTVEAARPDPLKLRVDVGVRPSLDLNRLSQVLVITGGAPPPLPSLAAPDTLAPKPRPKRSAAAAPRPDSLPAPELPDSASQTGGAAPATSPPPPSSPEAGP